MPGLHTVEKIGGTSMSRFGELMENVIVGRRKPADLYQRIFVVSAYGGVTNLLLQDKKTGAAGVYADFAAGREGWEDRLETVRARMKQFNAGFAGLGLDVADADAFVDERLDGVRSCLRDLMRVRSYGHLTEESYLPATQEMLSALGEAHSAYNSTLILRARGIQARFVDLTYWRKTGMLGLDEAVGLPFRDIDLAREMPIVTGYVKCDMGIMSVYARGYSEITFSKLAVVTGAREGIIHKEFHLSSGDPKLMGEANVEVIGQTNFDIADEMSDMNMEAIHSKAAREMQARNIPIRVKNAFDPEHPGTLISRDYRSATPKVDMICGRDDMLAIEVADADMVGRSGYDHELLSVLSRHGISYIAKNTSANTITHFVPTVGKIDACVSDLRKLFPQAEVRVLPVAIVSVLGTNLNDTRLLAQSVGALADRKIELLGINQAMQRVSIQLVIPRAHFESAQLCLHAALVEKR